MWIQMKLARSQVGILILAALLQRTPVIKYVFQFEKAISAPVAKIVRAFTVSAASLGGMHSMSGATEYVINPASPASATVGEEFTLAFSVIDTPANASSWRITGTIPPGLSIEGLVNDNINTEDPVVIMGTPTQAGSFDVIVKPFNGINQTAQTTTATTITINVAATVPEIIRDPVSTKVATGARAQFFFEATEGVETVQWKKDGAAIPGATASTLAVNDAGPGDEGSYTVEATNSAGSVESAAATLTIDDASSAELFNLATRGFVGTGGDILIPGLTVLGGTSKTVIVRGLGPALESFGVSGFLADPELKVFQTIFNESGVSVGSQLLVTNDDWDDGAGVAELSAALDEANIFPALQAGSKDAALLLTLNQGVYTFHLSGVGGSTGVGLVELFLFE